VKIQEEFPTMTLERINIELQKNLPEKPKITDQTVPNVLDEELFAIKKVYEYLIQSNADRVKWLRKEYAEWFSSVLQNNLQLQMVFVDERGRSKIGTRAIVTTSGKSEDIIDFIRNLMQKF
jgi:tRNA U38,U39,U40 pseudouridine synthase TruA